MQRACTVHKDRRAWELCMRRQVHQGTCTRGQCTPCPCTGRSVPRSRDVKRRRYNPVPEALELKHQLEDALRRGAAWYFEPPLNEEFMRQKYIALYFFHFVDAGPRFEFWEGERSALGWMGPSN